MNESQSFWRSWSKDYRFVAYLFAATLAIAIAQTFYFGIKGVDNIIGWDNLQEQESVESTIHEFQLGAFTLSIPAESFVIKEYFHGSPVTPNSVATYIYLTLLFSGLALLLAVLTTLDRFWFIAGFVLLALFIYSLRLPILRLFGFYNYFFSIGTGVSLLGLGIYFNILRPSAAFLTRLLAFTGLIILMGILIAFSSEVSYPFLHLAATSYTGSIVLSLLFILIVAHEIPASLAIVISRSSTGTRNVQHFLIVSLIYLVNVGLAGLHDAQIIDWDFLFIDPTLLLGISCVLGIWGFRDRQNLYENIVPFHPFGFYLYMALSVIGFATWIQFLGNANESALMILRHITYFAHTGFGLLFIMYVIVNYLDLLAGNVPLQKVLFKPVRMPYLSYQLAGLIATLGFAFYIGWQEYAYRGVAGFYNQLGDLDTKLGDYELRRDHFERARSYGYQDHHANYMMANILTDRLDFEEALPYYHRANGRWPSSYSIINEGNGYLWANQPGNAKKYFQDCLETFPHNGRISNNLGLVYSGRSNYDSTIYYLDDARNSNDSRAAAESNFLAYLAVEKIPVRTDSVMGLFGTSTSILANGLALANVQNQQLDVTIDPLSFHELDLHAATLLNNYLIQNTKTIDTTQLRRAMQIANHPHNGDYSEVLKVAIANGYYFRHDVKNALKIMAELVYMSQIYEGSYNYLQGLWALEQGNPEIATLYFDYALTQKYKKARLYYAIALTEARRFDAAIVAWDTLSRSGSGSEQQIASVMNQLLTTPLKEVLASDSDPLKYQFARYRMTEYDTSSFDLLVASIRDNNYKALTLYEMADRQFSWGHTRKAIQYLNQVSGMELTDPTVYESIRHLELLILADRGEVYTLAEQINNNITFDPKRQLEKWLYTALVSEASSDTTTAEPLYRILATYNPYFEEGVIAASRYFGSHSKDRFESYSLLADAVNINNTSPKLWAAYIKEAKRVGFDEYAESAQEQLNQLIDQKRNSRSIR